ncbi:MAG: hypothetical protein ACREA0_17490, partial [bacterium]
LLTVWELAVQHLSSIQELLPPSPAIPPSETFLDTLEARLKERHHDIDNLVNKARYEHILDALQSDLLAGQDIQSRLISLTEERPFRDVLHALADLQLDESPTDDQSSPMRRALIRYFPLIRCWRDVRIAQDGRIHHAVSLRSVVHFFDFARQVPGVEFRLYSPSREILHMRDEIDDILWLGASLISICSGALNNSVPLAKQVDPAILNNVERELSRTEEELLRLKAVLAQIRAARQTTDE